MSSHICRPGITQGYYPQKPDDETGVLENFVQHGLNSLKFVYQKIAIKTDGFAGKVNQAGQRVKQFSEEQLSTHIKQQKRKLRRDGLAEEHVVMAFAAIREISWRILGQRHYEVQIKAGWAMLNGMVVEMATGEGKTLTAALTASTAAMAGIPVHVITANDYLARRDQEFLEPLYQGLGLSSAFVIDGMSLADRHLAYSCDIVHITSQQLVFDYLRDRLTFGNDVGKLSLLFRKIDNEKNQKQPHLLKGLCFAIVDEIDSVLIDEARTPLIISRQQESEISEQQYFDALFLAGSLNREHNFVVDEQSRKISLTKTGMQSLESLAEILDKKWHRKKWREFWVIQALYAKCLFERDKQYLIRDNRIVIIDANTGRAMQDRSWELGLQQLIEAKENCPISQDKLPVGKISYQKFFRRYLKLAGMSGTVSEVAGELNSIYSLPVVKIPTHKPCKRVRFSERLYKTKILQHQALVSTLRALQEQGRPVLIGTRTVAESEAISRLLSKHHLPHYLINARNDEQEAEIIARAGETGNITVATNMAGRGTDIQPDEAVLSRGGLHVIATSVNLARRIDRQLYGRCARQGDPGSYEAILSLQDERLEAFYSTTILKLITRVFRNDKPLPDLISRTVIRLPQFWSEYRHYKTRKQLLRLDRQQEKTLAFTGRME